MGVGSAGATASRHSSAVAPTLPDSGPACPPVSPLLFARRSGDGDSRSIGIDGPDDIALPLTGGARFPPRGVPLALAGPPPTEQLPAYGCVLLDALDGGNALSVSGDAAVEAWRVVTPV